MTRFLIPVILWVCAVTAARADDSLKLARVFAGRWEGTGKFSYSVELKDKAFDLRIEIHADGTVTGTVGGATLAEARFKRHRPLNRPDRRDMMDYMISGKLTGPIIKEGNVTASTVYIPLDDADGKLEAAVNAHDCAIDGRSLGENVLMSGVVPLTKKQRGTSKLQTPTAQGSAKD